MFPQYNFSKSICAKSQSEIRDICNYLILYFGIDHFCFIRNYIDGTHICLTTHTEWMELVYKSYYRYDIFLKGIDSYFSGVHLWASLNNQESFVNFKQHSRIDNGIVLIDKQLDYCEFYNFATSERNNEIIDFYIANLDILWRHIFYFKDKAAHLIKQAEKDRLILPKRIEQQKSEPLVDINHQPLNMETIAPIKRYYINVNNDQSYLTQVEARCCYYLIRALSIKEIAKLINLSPRTVENHLNNVKHKFSCATTSDLIKVLHHSSFSRIAI